MQRVIPDADEKKSTAKIFELLDQDKEQSRFEFVIVKQDPASPLSVEDVIAKIEDAISRQKVEEPVLLLPLAYNIYESNDKSNVCNRFA